MAIYRTTDHEEIRKWVEEKGGEPAVVKGISGTAGEGILTIVFGAPGPDMNIISWPEFFSTFEEHQLRFRYEDPVPADEAGWDFAFEGRDEPIAGENDETELPEDIEDVDENMFPSAPADEDGRIL
jgi:hypothetical protein